MEATEFNEVLVFVAGSTPQIITETIQALICQKPPITPHSVRIITTVTGKRLVEKALIDEHILAELCQEYDIPLIKLNDADFLLLRDQYGNEIAELWSIEEHEAAADQIVNYLGELASDPKNRLHCSLAGGRKTMSYFMGLSFQLVARKWDKLYHILVSPDFEKNRSFYYKPRHNKVITAYNSDGGAKNINTDDAQVSLIELPLIYLRDKLFQGGTSLVEIVSAGQRSINSSSVQHPVNVNLPKRSLSIGNKLVILPPVLLTTYTAFLRMKIGRCKMPVRSLCAECTECFMSLVDMRHPSFIGYMGCDYRQIYGGDVFKSDELVKNVTESRGNENLLQQISKINKVIKAEIKEEILLSYYVIKSQKMYGASRYGVKVDKGLIHIE